MGHAPGGNSLAAWWELLLQFESCYLLASSTLVACRTVLPFVEVASFACLLCELAIGAWCSDH
jgi:hypothetical protein